MLFSRLLLHEVNETLQSDVYEKFKNIFQPEEKKLQVNAADGRFFHNIVNFGIK